ncbi:MAG: methyltransferase domain-containing protein [Candidatus Obscuribacterales bacterium]|nr:methyltransferase domain-containing protein [Candidatus Obscuribacterales bacterium]
MKDPKDISETSKSSDKWWLSFYQDTPFIDYLDTTHGEDKEDILNFIYNHCSLDRSNKAATRIFDQCCGVASISLPLAKDGFKVYAADICSQFIKEAERRAEMHKLKENLSLELADATIYLPPEKVDLALNLYTSFGYADHQTNLKMLKRAHQSLKPKGIFLLDFPNFHLVLSNFRKHIVREISASDGPITVVREAHLSPLEGRLKQTWTFIDKDGKRAKQESSLAIYLPDRLMEILKEVGFSEFTVFGDFKTASAYQIDSPRLIIQARA